MNPDADNFSIKDIYRGHSGHWEQTKTFETSIGKGHIVESGRFLYVGDAENPIQIPTFLNLEQLTQDKEVGYKCMAGRFSCGLQYFREQVKQDGNVIEDNYFAPKNKIMFSAPKETVVNLKKSGKALSDIQMEVLNNNPKLLEELFPQPPVFGGGIGPLIIKSLIGSMLMGQDFEEAIIDEQELPGGIQVRVISGSYKLGDENASE